MARRVSEEGEEVRLYSSTRDRRRWDQMQEFFAIIKTTEHLENARIKSAISNEEYERECNVLISQFKDTERALVTSNVITSTQDFLSEYGLGDCAYAIERLVKYGVPATVIHRGVDDGHHVGRARQAAEATQCFITAMDALKLEQRAVDEIQPLMSDLMDRLNKVDGLPQDFSGTLRVRQWLIELNNMRAADELSEEQVRQLSHDIENSYSDFFKHLENAKQ